MKPTIRSVAAAAGVSKSTVALALNHDPRLAEETRIQVLRVAEKMGYRPNPLVRKLMTQLRAGRAVRYKSTLAVLNGSTQPSLAEDPHSHRGRLAAGIHARARELGFETVEFRLRDPELNGARLRRILRARGIEGAVVVSPREHGSLPAAFAEVWADFAVVVAGRRVATPAVSCAANDQYATMLMTVREMRARGYRRIGLALGNDERLEHRFTAGFWAAQIDLSTRRWLPVLDIEKRAEELPAWFKKNRPDAIVTYDHRLPRLLRRAGVEPFREVALAHLDWNPALRGWHGADQRTEELGAVAVDMLAGQIQRHEMGPPRVQRFTLIESRWMEPAPGEQPRVED